MFVQTIFFNNEFKYARDINIPYRIATQPERTTNKILNNFPSAEKRKVFFRKLEGRNRFMYKTNMTILRHRKII